MKIPQVFTLIRFYIDPRFLLLARKKKSPIMLDYQGFA